MSKPKVRNRFSDRVSVIAMEGESKTQQHFREVVDINNILARYRKTGIIDHVSRARERYGDLTELADYAVNMDKVAKAKQAFEMLPAELRNQFNNSIPGFFSFIQDPKNKEKCIEWGIFNKPIEPKPADAGAAANPAEGGKQTAKPSKKGEEA